jgi:hypothetical protein
MQLLLTAKMREISYCATGMFGLVYLLKYKKYKYKNK